MGKKVLREEQTVEVINNRIEPFAKRFTVVCEPYKKIKISMIVEVEDLVEEEDLELEVETDE